MSSSDGRPAGLGQAGARLWRQVSGDFTLRADETVLLGAACMTLDTIAKLEEAMIDAPLVVEGSMHQLREHPLLSELRQQRLTVARLLRQLDLLDVDELAQLRSAARSAKGRALARERWS
jgi:ABC-type hemin transport system ATPase subunit